MKDSSALIMIDLFVDFMGDNLSEKAIGAFIKSLGPNSSDIIAESMEKRREPTDKDREFLKDLLIDAGICDAEMRINDEFKTDL